MYFDDHRKSDDKLGKVTDPVKVAVKFVKTRSPREKLGLLCGAAVVVRIFLQVCLRSSSFAACDPPDTALHQPLALRRRSLSSGK
jgi:hypothetical protein